MSYLMSWSSYDGGEDGSWSVISGKSGFAHTRSIVHNQGSDILIHDLVWKTYEESVVNFHMQRLLGSRE